MYAIRSYYVGRAGIIKIDVKIIATDCKIKLQFLVVISELNGLDCFALRNVDKTVKTKNGADKSSDQQNHDTQMNDINTKARPAPTFSV